jgi:hypothetical protein
MTAIPRSSRASNVLTGMRIVADGLFCEATKPA